MNQEQNVDNRMSGYGVFTEVIATSIRDAFSAKTAIPWTLHPSPAAEEDADLSLDSALTVSLRLKGALEGEVFLLLRAKSSAALEGMLSKPSQDPAEGWFALVDATRASLNAALAPTLDSSIAECKSTTAHDDCILLRAFLLEASGGRQLVLSLAASPELAVSLKAFAESIKAEGSPHTNHGDGRAPKIERVLDVPLAVTLRFGQRHLKLREVLALDTGSLVELDRQVDEPVDLVLGDRLIARGEVVVVDGNYGLRVTEVIEGAARRIQGMHASSGPQGETSSLSQ